MRCLTLAETAVLRHIPLVIGPPHVRFYVGAPLMTDDGHALGTLCMLDRTVRQLSKEQADALLVLASPQVVVSTHVGYYLECEAAIRQKK